MCDIKSFRVTGGTVNFTTPCFYFISVLPLKSNGRQNVQGSEKKKRKEGESVTTNFIQENLWRETTQV